MTRPIVRIHNIETNEILDREMNDQEFAQYEKDLLDSEAEIEFKNVEAEQRKSLLNRLGLTEEEAAILLK